MALDKEPVTMAYALKVAKKYYSADTYNHILRVMQYIAENEMIPNEYRDDCLVLAIMHDLLEDTDYLGNALPLNMKKALDILTKPKDMDYIEYIKKIRSKVCTPWGMCAWWVKLADMKDHLAQVETLTDKLKDKYLAALPYLL